MNIALTIKTLRSRLLKLTDSLSFLAPALIRVTVGLVFVSTGWGKLKDLDSVTEYFTSLGIPMPGLNAAVASCTEFFGGILILIGLGARLVALPMAFTMVVAMATAQRAEITGLFALVGLDEWGYLVMFLVIALRGAGGLSLDALLARFFARGASEPAKPVAPMVRANDA